MKLFVAWQLLLLFSLTAPTIAIAITLPNYSNPEYAKPGCDDMCGNIRIPYPFGIGVDCSVNIWYNVDCNSSTPYLSALNGLVILEVNLGNQTVTVNTPKYSDCQNQSGQTMSMDLGESPFLFSKSHNKFVFEGCGNALMMGHGSKVLTGCSTNCLNVRQNDTLQENGPISTVHRNGCFGTGCCQGTIPHYLKSYNISITRQGGACGSAFVADKNSYVFDDNSSYVPVSLLWTLSQADVDQIAGCRYSYEYILEADLGDDTTMNSWRCFYLYPSAGNPYINFPYRQNEMCARCMDNGNYCDYDSIYDPDLTFIRRNFTCREQRLPPLGDKENKENKTSLGVILGISISMGVISLVATSYLLYKVIKKTKDRRQRKRFFKRNGGLLLKQQQEADPSLVGKTILFTSLELKKATDNFNDNRILGRGGQGTVFKGMLVDGRIVAVKKSKIVDERQLQQFINEVVILSQVNHRNVVKLLGCCLETDVPLLVSEFIPNGTLYDRVHKEIDESPISLNMRLQIATEVAGAVAYLHSATSIPIYHRDIKTTNILLDDKYRAKVSDFGTSRFVAMDQTHLTTLVKGTFGYLDPEYFQSSQFTEKSDVYSFGVVLVELLTGERPISLTRFGETRSLATHFMLAMEEGRVMSIFDATVIKEGMRNELLEVANLALRCLNLNGRYRPTMKEVAIELETIRMSHIPSNGQTTIVPVMYTKELSMSMYGDSSSTFLSSNDNISQ